MSETSVEPDLLDEFADEPGIEGSVAKDRRRRRIRRIITLLVVLAAVVALVLWVRGRPSTSAAPTAPAIKTEKVTTQDIRNDESFDGSIGYASAQPFVARASGRVTALAPQGSRVSLGDIVFAVDATPTVVFYGDLPAWRSLSSSSSDGPDIAQLEQSLVSLGFDPNGAITVDEEWTSATTEAVKRWQRSLDVDDTGEVELGAVVFQPSSVVVGRHQTNVGGSITSGAVVAQADEAGLTMTFTIDPDSRALIAIGQEVDVTMPDRTAAKGEITAIGTQTDPLTGDVLTVGTGRVKAKEGAVPPPDQAPIKVRVTQTVATKVVVVPATALTSYVDGTFTVTTVNGSGATTRVPVKVGLAGDGFVQVTGDGIAPGVEVVVPGD